MMILETNDRYAAFFAYDMDAKEIDVVLEPVIMWMTGDAFDAGPAPLMPWMGSMSLRSPAYIVGTKDQTHVVYLGLVGSHAIVKRANFHLEKLTEMGAERLLGGHVGASEPRERMHNLLERGR